MTNPVTPRTLGDRVAAYHESGHCVAAFRNGWSLRVLTLFPGGAGCCELSSSWEEDLREDPVKFLIYLAAGAAAERRLCGYASARCAQDVETATAIASEIIYDGVPAQDPRVQRTLHTSVVLADALMRDPHIWREVEVIAPALRERHRLPVAEVRQLLLREAAR